LSPTQTQGPFSLSQEDIRARVASGDEMDDYLPALSSMFSPCISLRFSI
jgi:hypothetical protein